MSIQWYREQVRLITYFNKHSKYCHTICLIHRLITRVIFCIAVDKMNLKRVSLALDNAAIEEPLSSSKMIKASWQLHHIMSE